MGMDPRDLKLPESEFVFALPTGFDKIWKILWAVDSARLKQVDVATKLGGIALNHQIAVSKTLADLHASEAKAMQEMQNVLKIG
jgi:hypothetical protein